jgi:hypothetical protein
MIALGVRRPRNHWQCPASAAAVSPEARNEASRIFYGDVPIGTIGIDAGVPVVASQPVHRHGPGV